MDGEMLPLDNGDELFDVVSIPATGQVISVGQINRSWPCSNTYNWTTTEFVSFVFRHSANLTMHE
jgi:formate/nitrite transporter FocA (FNT family)